MKRLFIFFIFTIITFSILYSEERVAISGIIKNINGNPIGHATISIDSTTRSTYTNSSGIYNIQTTIGVQTIVVSAVGYTTIRQKINVKEATTLDFTLDDDPIMLETLQVYAKTHSELLRQKAFAASNIDIQPIVATLININDIVSRTSGVNVREDGGVGSDFNLSINGLTGNAVRYFIDGVPMSILGSSVSLSNLPVNMVERIEIYKGVVPANFGEDALGGAINIITRRNRSKYLDISVGAGSFHTYKADLNAQYVHTKSGFTLRPMLGFNYSKNDYIMRDVEVWDNDNREYRLTNKRRFHDAYRSAIGKIETGFLNTFWADEALIGVTFSAEHRELQTGQKQSIVIGEATRDKKSLNITARYAKRNFLTNNFDLNLFASYTADHILLIDTSFRKYAWDGTWMKTSYSEVTGRGKSMRHYNRPQALIKANFNYAITAQHTLNLNYMMSSVYNKRYDDLDKQFIPTNDLLDKHIIGLSYNYRTKNNRLNMSMFLKDYILHSELKQQDMYWLTGINDITPSSTKNNIGFGLGSRFTLIPEFSLKASYERSVRLPIAIEFLGNGQTIYPNFKLKPEKSNNINFGIFGKYKPHKQHVINYESNLFIRQVTDYILRTILGDRQSQYLNVAASMIQGVEGEISYEYNNILRVTANATYLNERNKTKLQSNGSINITYNNRIPNKPWLLANAELSYNQKNIFGLKRSDMRINYVIRYVHWFYLTWEAFGNKSSKEIIPTQIVNDISVMWSFEDNRYAFSVECSNIFNQKVYDNYMLQKPGRAFFGKFRVFIN